MRSLFSTRHLLVALLFVPVAAFAQDEDPARVTDEAVVADLAQRFEGADVLAYDARAPLAALAADGLFAVHTANGGLTLHASLFEGAVADWIVTDATGVLGGVQPIDSASGDTWACASGAGSIVCWNVTPPEAAPADEMPEDGIPEDGQINDGSGR